MFSSYLNSLVSVSLTSFILESICTFSGRGKRLSSALGLITSLCIFLTCISPFLTLIKRASDMKIPNFESKSEAHLNNESQFNNLLTQDLETRLKDEILRKTGIFISSIDINISTSDNDNFAFFIEITHEKLTETDKEEIINLLKLHLGENVKYSFTETHNDQNGFYN